MIRLKPDQELLDENGNIVKTVGGGLFKRKQDS